MNGTVSKKEIVKELGISRASLYYQHTLPGKDWKLKTEIEQVMHEFPSYGHRRVGDALGINHKRANRVMKKFGIKPYRRRRKPRKKRDTEAGASPHENLLLQAHTTPRAPNEVWVSDFTYLMFRGRFVYLATVLDLYTREVIGKNILTAHTVCLTRGALLDALDEREKPALIVHSDPGSEYRAKEYRELAEAAGIELSMSRKASPWENGYQESFYSQFKVDLGDPNRFTNLGELVYEVYRTIYIYNHKRIHTALKMPPKEYCRRYYERSKQTVNYVSKKMGT